MKLWGYYAFCTFINSIKKMFRSTFIIIVAISLGIGLIFGVSIGVIASIVESEDFADTEYNTEEGFFDEEGNFYYNDEAFLDENGEVVFYDELEVEMTDEEFAQMMLVLEAGIAMLVLVLLIFGAYSGMKKGSDIFTMADVNFLFTAPMKPQSVLLFRLTFQMLATIAGSIYFLFQIPNLVLNAGVSLEVCLIGFLALVIVFIFQKLVSVGMYTITATYPDVKKYILPGVIGILGVLTLATGAVYMNTGQDVWKTLELTWASHWSRWIPVIGWVKAVVMNACEGNIIMVILQLLLLILAMAVLVYFIWNMKADFYEDAMAGAQEREDILLAAAENRKPISVNEEKDKKKDHRKIKEKENLSGQGAVVFFTKELLCRKRLARFGIITGTMSWYVTIMAVCALANVYLFESDSFNVAGFIVMAVLFFRNYGNPIAQETSLNWLFLVPESPYKKVFFAMLAGTYATFMDLLPGMLLFAVICKNNPLEMVLWMAVFITMDFMLSGVGMILEALFPADAMNQVKASLQLMLKFFMILFIVIAIVVGVVINGIVLGLVFNLIMNLILGAVSFMIYPSMLHDGIS